MAPQGKWKSSEDKGEKKKLSKVNKQKSVQKNVKTSSTEHSVHEQTSSGSDPNPANQVQTPTGSGSGSSGEKTPSSTGALRPLLLAAARGGAGEMRYERPERMEKSERRLPVVPTTSIPRPVGGPQYEARREIHGQSKIPGVKYGSDSGSARGRSHTNTSFKSDSFKPNTSRIPSVSYVANYGGSSNDADNRDAQEQEDESMVLTPDEISDIINDTPGRSSGSLEMSKNQSAGITAEGFRRRSELRKNSYSAASGTEKSRDSGKGNTRQTSQERQDAENENFEEESFEELYSSSLQLLRRKDKDWPAIEEEGDTSDADNEASAPARKGREVSVNEHSFEKLTGTPYAAEMNMGAESNDMNSLASRSVNYSPSNVRSQGSLGESRSRSISPAKQIGSPAKHHASVPQSESSKERTLAAKKNSSKVRVSREGFVAGNQANRLSTEILDHMDGSGSQYSGSQYSGSQYSKTEYDLNHLETAKMVEFSKHQAIVVEQGKLGGLRSPNTTSMDVAAQQSVLVDAIKTAKAATSSFPVVFKDPNEPTAPLNIKKHKDPNAPNAPLNIQKKTAIKSEVGIRSKATENTATKSEVDAPSKATENTATKSKVDAPSKATENTATKSEVNAPRKANGTNSPADDHPFRTSVDLRNWGGRNFSDSSAAGAVGVQKEEKVLKKRNPGRVSDMISKFEQFGSPPPPPPGVGPSGRAPSSSVAGSGNSSFGSSAAKK